MPEAQGHVKETHFHGRVPKMPAWIGVAIRFTSTIPNGTNKMRTRIDEVKVEDQRPLRSP